MNKEDETVKKFNMPHTYVILFAFIIIAAILTWIIPAGQFESAMVDGREVIDPETFQYVESNGQGIFNILLSIPAGFARSQGISFFLFVVGGAFHIINETGVIETLLTRVIAVLKGKEMLVIPGVLLIMGLAGGTIGMSEETIMFIALGVTLARALGYDALVGMSMIALGAGIGFTSGIMNPFSVGVAQSIAGVPLFSGIELRIVLFIVLWIATSFLLVRYANRVKEDPTKSIVYEEELEFSENQEIATIDTREYTTRQKIITAVLLGGFAIIVYGVIGLGWFITEIGAVFLGIGIISGLIGKMSTSEVAENFIVGAKDMMFAALIVGLAQSLVVILENGLILDTIIYALSNAVGFLPSVLSAVGMYFLQIIINFFVVSGSGQAAVTMPLMAPLADSLGVTRQTAVLAFHLGDGFTNSIIPMSGVLMAQLGVAKISYQKWVKFVTPIIITWLTIGVIFVVIAQAFGYGPF